MAERIRVSRDGSVTVNGEVVGSVFGESRNWWFMLADCRESARTPPGGWHSRQEAGEMCASAYRETRAGSMGSSRPGCPSKTASGETDGG